MKKLIFIPCFILAGCATTAVPVAPKFPTAPDTLIEDCPALQTLPEGAKLSDLMRTDVKNMVQYHECSRKNKAWVEWFKTQKQLFEQATK
jgi:hypothetical protein